jgi:GntR family transcriptional regulator, galactonate operon transcriptional repressor
MNKPTTLDDRPSSMGRVRLADVSGIEAVAAAAPERPQARRNLYAQVVHELGQRIAAGEFPPGAALPIESELAAQLGVSRNLLREAVKALASKRLVEVRPRSGTRVRPRGDWHLLDPDVLGWLDAVGQGLPHALDLVEFRLIVEPAASRLAALRATPAEKAGIAAACAALEACVGQPELIPARDIAFHGRILAASHNSVLNHLGSLIASLMQLQVTTTTDHPGAFERGLPLHRELAEAIARGEARRAEDISRRLVSMPYQDLAGRLRLPTARMLEVHDRPRS